MEEEGASKKQDPDEVIYDDDDLPKKHQKSVMEDLSGGVFHGFFGPGNLWI